MDRRYRRRKGKVYDFHAPTPFPVPLEIPAEAAVRITKTTCSPGICRHISPAEREIVPLS